MPVSAYKSDDIYISAQLIYFSSKPTANMLLEQLESIFDSYAIEFLRDIEKFAENMLFSIKKQQNNKIITILIETSSK